MRVAERFGATNFVTSVTAWKYMQVAKHFDGHVNQVNAQDDAGIDVSALYALAAPSTPQPARDAALDDDGSADDAMKDSSKTAPSVVAWTNRAPPKPPPSPARYACATAGSRAGVHPLQHPMGEHATAQA